MKPNLHQYKRKLGLILLLLLLLIAWAWLRHGTTSAYEEKKPRVRICTKGISHVFKFIHFVLGTFCYVTFEFWNHEGSGVSRKIGNTQVKFYTWKLSSPPNPLLVVLASSSNLKLVLYMWILLKKPELIYLIFFSLSHTYKQERKRALEFLYIFFLYISNYAREL